MFAPRPPSTIATLIAGRFAIYRRNLSQGRGKLGLHLKSRAVDSNAVTQSLA